MEIRDTRVTAKPGVMKSVDIPIGTVFQGRAGSFLQTLYEKATLLKHYSGIVSLDNPRLTWAPGSPEYFHEYEVVNAVLTIS
jgi:hypothetical protein